MIAKSDFIALKLEVDKLDTNELAGLKNLKTEINKLDVDKLKAVPKNFKKIMWCSG